MKLGYLILIMLSMLQPAYASELRLLDQGGTYEIQLGGGGPWRLTQNFQASCLKAPRLGAPQIGMCTADGAPPALGGPCPPMQKSFEESCYKKVYDAETTRAVIDQNLKGSLDTLTIAVKDSYKLLITSQEFRTMVRDEVRKALAEQAASN